MWSPRPEPRGFHWQTLGWTLESAFLNRVLGFSDKGGPCKKYPSGPNVLLVTLEVFVELLFLE